MQVDMTGKVALITGAGGGIGRGMAQMFARNGAIVIVNDVNAETGGQTVDLVKQAGGTASFSKRTSAVERRRRRWPPGRWRNTARWISWSTMLAST